MPWCKRDASLKYIERPICCKHWLEATDEETEADALRKLGLIRIDGVVVERREEETR
jgi:hypothetical protein